MPGDNVEMTLYIPLCFLLIREPCWIMRRHRGLYIPLCFLLILLPDPLFRLPHPPLHSTMFSINPQRRSQVNIVCLLYIPLCFLLIKAGNEKKQPQCWSLHSTMFSINRNIRRGRSRNTVTLHSTMFSINQNNLQFSESSLLSLHSTMFSINLSAQREITSFICLYIPLCFLLIDYLLWFCA